MGKDYCEENILKESVLNKLTMVEINEKDKDIIDQGRIENDSHSRNEHSSNKMIVISNVDLTDVEENASTQDATVMVEMKKQPEIISAEIHTISNKVINGEITTEIDQKDRGGTLEKDEKIDGKYICESKKKEDYDDANNTENEGTASPKDGRRCEVDGIMVNTNTVCSTENEGVITDCDEVDGGEYVFVQAEVKETKVALLGLVAPDGTRRLSNNIQIIEQNEKAMDNTDRACPKLVDKLKIEKTKLATLIINGCTVFCEISTVCYKSGDKILKQHYISQVKGDVEGDIGLEPLDELLKVNGKELQNLAQGKVKKIFKEIKMRKKDSTLGIDMVVRRWVKDESSTDRDPVWTDVKEIRIKLVLVPADQAKSWARKFRDFVQRKKVQKYRRQLSVRKLDELTLKNEELPRGNIRVTDYSSDQDSEGHVKVCNTGNFLMWDHDGMLQSSVLTEGNQSSTRFVIERFRGNDMGPKPVTIDVFGVRLYCKKPENQTGPKWFIHYDEDFDVSCKAFPDEKIRTDDIDERCFIIRSIGNQMLLQSAVERDRFLSPVNENFVMKEIDVSSLEDIVAGKSDKLTDFDGCWFEFDHFKEINHRYKATFLDNVINIFACGTSRSNIT